MNKKLLVCLLLGSISHAQANDFSGINTAAFANGPRLYAGGSIAAAEQGDLCNIPFFDGACDKQDFAWKAFGGVQLNPMLGAELSYNHLGSANLDGLIGSDRVKMENELSGTAVSGLAYLPLSAQDNITLIGKAGVMFWERKTSQTIDTTTQTSQDEGISPLIGGGAQYRLNNNLYLRGEWEHIFNTGADSNYETDADLYSLGFMYSTL